jgi:hypothetical protein
LSVAVSTLAAFDFMGVSLFASAATGDSAGFFFAAATASSTELTIGLRYVNAVRSSSLRHLRVPSRLPQLAKPRIRRGSISLH